MFEKVIVLSSRLINTIFVLTSRDKPKVVDYGLGSYSFTGHNVVRNRPNTVTEYITEMITNTFAFIYINIIKPLLLFNEDVNNMVMVAYNLFTTGLYIESPIKPFKSTCTNKEIFDIISELPGIKMHADDNGIMDLGYLHNASSKNDYESQGIIMDFNKKRVKRYNSKTYSDDDSSLRIAFITINTHMSLVHLRDFHFYLSILSAIILNNVKSDSVARLLSPFISGSFAVPDFSTKVLTTNNGVLAQTINNNNTQEMNDLIETFFNAYSFDNSFNNFMKLKETKDYFELCKRFVIGFPSNGIDYDEVKKTMISKGYMNNTNTLSGYDIVGYVLAAQSLGHNLMTGYFSMLHYCICTQTKTDNLSLSTYKFEISASTAFRATRITSRITDNFDYLFLDNADKILFNKFQQDVELFLFKMKLISLPSHTNIPRSAYG